MKNYRFELPKTKYGVVIEAPNFKKAKEIFDSLKKNK